MPNSRIVEKLGYKFNSLVGNLDERGRRRWAASEAMELGYGGITAAAQATGVSDCTIRNGVRELQCNDPLSSGRQRREGVGRKPLEHFNTTWSNRLIVLTSRWSEVIHNRHCGGFARV